MQVGTKYKIKIMVLLFKRIIGWIIGIIFLIIALMIRILFFMYKFKLSHFDKGFFLIVQNDKIRIFMNYLLED